MKNKTVKNLFEKDIAKIFNSNYAPVSCRGNSQYIEDVKNGKISFVISGGCSFEQLEKLSVLLGSKNIDYMPEHYFEYFGEWEATIRISNVNFSRVRD